MIKLLCLLFLPLFAFGQKNCQGIIADKITGAGIPFASVGLLIENKGVNSDEQGKFNIKSFFPQTDSLRVSSVGYETMTLPIAGWVQGKKIELVPTANLMSEVLISNKPRKIVSLNSYKNCSSHWFMIGQETMYQLAQRFDVSEPGLQLTGITLCKDRSRSVFRIRVYDYDSITKSPSRDIADSLIEIRSADSKVRIDLNNYNIIIPGKSFFVAVEWVFVPDNEGLDKVKLNGKKLTLFG